MAVDDRRARLLGAVGTGAVYVIITIWAALSLIPVYWMFVTAFEGQGDIISIPPHWFPYPATLDNFHTLFENSYIPRWFLNSLLVSSATTIGQVIFCSMAGYSFAKLRYPGRMFIFWVLLSMLMVPGIVTLIPLFLLASNTNLINTYAILIVPGLTSIWGIFLVKQFIQTLPSTLLDAARVDACSEFGVYWKVILPLAKPAVAVLSIFWFIGSWNDFFWWLLMTSSTSMFNLPVGLADYRYTYSTDYGSILAGAIISAVPVIFVFFLFQRYFMQGLTIGAVKG